MTNTIFIEGGAYDDVKKALKQWISLYSDNLPASPFFELYKNGRGKHIIHADDKVGNEQFNYLINYLKYPEEIDYKIEIIGYTKINDTNLFPKNKIGEDIMIFIPDSDDEYDNVYWTGTDNKVYKTDFGGKTTEVNISKNYKQFPDFNIADLPDPEIFLSEHKPATKLIGEPEKEENIGKRFKIISIILGLLLIAGLFTYQNNARTFSYIYYILGLGTWTWFITDYKMLRVIKYYNLSFLIALLIFLYSYYIQKSNPFYSFFDLSGMFAILPLIFIVIQKPLRIGFKKIMKREPIVERPALSFADFIYTILLFAAPFFISWMLGIFP